MSSYFDVVSGFPGSEKIDKSNYQAEYRYYKCVKNSCNKVTVNDTTTINIPTYIPEALDKCLIRYQLKTFLPITIS
jgi:hypothetical protein